MERRKPGKSCPPLYTVAKYLIFCQPESGNPRAKCLGDNFEYQKSDEHRRLLFRLI